MSSLFLFHCPLHCPLAVKEDVISISLGITQTWVTSCLTLSRLSSCQLLFPHVKMRSVVRTTAGSSSSCVSCILTGFTKRDTDCPFVLDCLFKDVYGEQSWMIETVLPSEAKSRHAYLRYKRLEIPPGQSSSPVRLLTMCAGVAWFSL